VRGWATRKRLAWCGRCERVEFVEEAGPLFVRCTECLCLVPRALENR